VAAALLASPVRKLALLYGSAFQLQGLSAFMGATVLGGSIMLAWLGSWVAASRHIRAIEPS
jgi:cell division transport system permease protein